MLTRSGNMMSVLLLIDFCLMKILLFHMRTVKDYKPEEAVDIDPIGTPFNWLTNANWQNSFRAGTDPPKYFGTTVAGQAEFPWVCDLRNLDALGHPWDWGTANLISDLWALTACSVVKDWDRIQHEGGFVKSGTWVVFFFTNYVWEDYIRYDAHNQKVYHIFRGHDEVGTRGVERIIKHPQCNVTTRLFNLMLVKVTHRIPVYVPVIGYMPIFEAPMSVSGESISLKESVYPPLYFMDGHLSKYKKLLCYVASVGRPYFNVEKPLNYDYKVKYRAYFSNFEYCNEDTYNLWRALCINNGNNPKSDRDKNVINQDCVDSIKKNAPKNAGIDGQFMCFRTYARHGAVCDHDRGAPLVCNGEVYGFVVRGVPPEYCLNTRMFPFIVMKLDVLQGARLYPQPPALPYFVDPVTG